MPPRRYSIHSGSYASFDLLRDAWSQMLADVQRVGIPLAGQQGFVARPPVLQREHQTHSWSWRETSFLKWLFYGSWGQCQACKCHYSRVLEQQEMFNFQGMRRKLTKQCYACSKGVIKYVVPTSEQYPCELKALPTRIVHALAPIVIHQGSPKKHRHGYVRKDTLSHLSWAKSSVRDQLKALPQPDRRVGIKAFCWLLMHNEPYKAYIEAHKRVLATNQPLALQASAILEPYIESAIFPQLYPLAKWCESYLLAAEAWSAPFEHQAHAKAHKYASVKAAFVQKLLCKIPDYGASYTLLQFNFDRYLLSHLKTRGEIAAENGVDGSYAEQDKHWTSQYWKNHHTVLIDVVHEHGYPDLFLTLSPYEWSMPWPMWITQAHEILGRGPSELPGPEAIALAHALHQCISGFVAGYSGTKPWDAHIFGAKDGSSNPVKIFFGRYEFQDGGSSHEYGKGRGSLHLHCLFWLDDIRKVNLETLLTVNGSEDFLV